MELNTKMTSKLKPFYKRELIAAENAFSQKRYQQSWHHLERAHILGQPYPLQHTQVHWRMLMFGIQLKKSKEIIGQIPRLLFGGIKSFVGKIPIGNTGGADVPPLKPMEIPEELKQIIQTNTKD